MHRYIVEVRNPEAIGREREWRPPRLGGVEYDERGRLIVTATSYEAAATLLWESYGLGRHLQVRVQPVPLDPPEAIFASVPRSEYTIERLK